MFLISRKKGVKKSDCGKTFTTDILQVGGEYINKETKIEEVDYNYLKQMLKDMFSKVHVEFEDLMVLLLNIKWDNLSSFVEPR